jgi:hypothetical protein
VLVSDNEPAGAAIVGFWKFTFVSQNNPGIPDGTVLEVGYAQWHSDGTEITNSSRSPATGNFCLGVWKKTGPSSFKLNHFALSFDLSGKPVGGANIRKRSPLNVAATNSPAHLLLITSTSTESMSATLRAMLPASGSRRIEPGRIERHVLDLKRILHAQIASCFFRRAHNPRTDIHVDAKGPQTAMAAPKRPSTTSQPQWRTRIP